MKEYLCTTTVLGVETLWDISMKHAMMIHFVKKLPEREGEQALYTYEVTMDEEEALMVVLSNAGITLAKK